MNNVEKKPVIGISVGDPNGIGPEVILKVFSNEKVLNYCTPVLYACKNLIGYYTKLLNLKEIPIEVIRNPKQVREKKLNLFCNWLDEQSFTIEPGQSNSNGGWYALKSLQAGVYAVKNQIVQALVTAPINKYNIQSEEFSFSGHSEFLMKEAGVNDFLMLLLSDDIRVGLVTVHIPLKEVTTSISVEKVLGKLKILHESLERDFAIKRPKIAVLGINPHAGENGLIGNEEIEVLIPALEKANNQGIMALGPFPADGFFGSRMQYKYDGVLAMYHDQGLAPFKSLVFGSAVNYTAGLPFIRTSPGHGTAFNIAGQNIADENSFREALFTALKIISNRDDFDEAHKNPLQRKIKLEKEE